MTDETPNLDLNITDIASAVQAIDYAAEQGAFKGWSNIRQILALRDRLQAAVTIANALQENTASQSQPKEKKPDEIFRTVKTHARRRRA